MVSGCSLCSQTSLLMIICICSRSPALASGLSSTSGHQALDSHEGRTTQVPYVHSSQYGFSLQWESNASDLTGGGAQAVM